MKVKMTKPFFFFFIYQNKGKDKPTLIKMVNIISHHTSPKCEHSYTDCGLQHLQLYIICEYISNLR